MDHIPFYRRNLPHIQPPEGTFFVTYRLHNSLTADQIKAVESFSKSWKMKYPDAPKEELQKIAFRFRDRILDKDLNEPRWLKNPTVANVVLDSLIFRHEVYYELAAVCIMSNHVHILLDMLKGAPPLYDVLRMHKSFTAVQSNKILNRSGPFWERESYDHLVRNKTAFLAILRYILCNPVKARMVKHWQDWPFTWLNPKYNEACNEAQPR